MRRWQQARGKRCSAAVRRGQGTAREGGSTGQGRDEPGWPPRGELTLARRTRLLQLLRAAVVRHHLLRPRLNLGLCLGGREQAQRSCKGRQAAVKGKSGCRSLTHSGRCPWRFRHAVQSQRYALRRCTHQHGGPRLVAKAPGFELSAHAALQVLQSGRRRPVEREGARAAANAAADWRQEQAAKHSTQAYTSMTQAVWKGRSLHLEQRPAGRETGSASMGLAERSRAAPGGREQRRQIGGASWLLQPSLLVPLPLPAPTCNVFLLLQRHEMSADPALCSLRLGCPAPGRTRVLSDVWGAGGSLDAAHGWWRRPQQKRGNLAAQCVCSAGASWPSKTERAN